jgi:cobalt/nickel transport system permease protein
VYLAMVSRGYDGRLPLPETGGASTADWVRSAVLPVAAAVIALAAVLG